MSTEFTIYRKDGSETDQKLTLDSTAFNIDPHDHAIYLAVKTELTNMRQGNSSTKTRGEARGGGRKPWKQKGRGTARAGSRRSPIWVGGGRAFGPKPKIYLMKINQKVKTLARKSALAYKYQEGAIRVMEDFVLDTPKTKTMLQILKAMSIEDKRITLLASEVTQNLLLACRNLYNILLIEAKRASTYDMLDCDILLIDRAGLEELNNQLLAN